MAGEETASLAERFNNITEKFGKWAEWAVTIGKIIIAVKIFSGLMGIATTIMAAFGLTTATALWPITLVGLAIAAVIGLV